jgi:hypothetical protein
MNHFIIGSRLFKTLFPNNERIQKRCKETADYDVLVESEPSDETIKYFKDIRDILYFREILLLFPVKTHRFFKVI